MSVTAWTHDLPSNGEEGEAFEHFNCRLCAYHEAWWVASDRGLPPTPCCQVFARAMLGKEKVFEIVCAEVPGAWPYGRAFQCSALECWRVPIPQGDERERLRIEAMPPGFPADNRSEEE